LLVKHAQKQADVFDRLVTASGGGQSIRSPQSRSHPLAEEFFATLNALDTTPSLSSLDTGLYNSASSGGSMPHSRSVFLSSPSCAIPKIVFRRPRRRVSQAAAAAAAAAAASASGSVAVASAIFSPEVQGTRTPSPALPGAGSVVDSPAAAPAPAADSDLEHEVVFSLTPALHAASAAGYDEIVRLLLHYGADPSDCDVATGRASLFFAGTGSVASLLIEAGAAVSQALSDRTTPLHVAAAADRVDVCEALLRAGARVNEANLNGTTALLSAVKRGHADVCRMLLELGRADVSAANINGASPLLVAAQGNNRGLCELLLKHGAPVDQRNVNGASALLLASQVLISAFVVLLSVV
jgi:hypothetical protein